MSISVSVCFLTQLPQWRLSHSIDFKIFCIFNITASHIKMFTDLKLSFKTDVFVFLCFNLRQGKGVCALNVINVLLMLATVHQCVAYCYHIINHHLSIKQRYLIHDIEFRNTSYYIQKSWVHLYINEIC